MQITKMSVSPHSPLEISKPGGVAEPQSRDDEERVNLFILCALALAVGVMTGCGAVALRALTASFTMLFSMAS